MTGWIELPGGEVVTYNLTALLVHVLNRGNGWVSWSVGDTHARSWWP